MQFFNSDGYICHHTIPCPLGKKLRRHPFGSLRSQIKRYAPTTFYLLPPTVAIFNLPSSRLGGSRGKGSSRCHNGSKAESSLHLDCLSSFGLCVWRVLCCLFAGGRSNTNVTHVCVSFFNFPALELNSSITTPYHVYLLAVVIERLCIADRQSCLQIVGVLIKCCHELAERKKRLTCFPVALVTPLVLSAVRIQLNSIP